MCGISGIIGLGCKVEPDEIVKMNTIIRHRGPDDEGYLLANSSDNLVISAGGEDTPEEVWKTKTPYQPIKRIKELKGDFDIALGHRRLSILDLSPLGHFPMSYQGSRFWITYNGEIYNFVELKGELEGLGYSFKTQTDTEVILAAYMQWGEECLDRFVGMFSLCIFDAEEKEIFLARDRFGIKPLYYWFSPSGSFHFASEIKQFTVCNGWKAKMNKQRVYDFLFYTLTDHTNETMFQRVYQLPPAHYFKSKVKNIQPSGKGTIETERWYNIPKANFHGTLAEAGEEFKKYFKSAIKLHLRSDVSVGSALSGGLDSSAIVCEINQLLKEEEKQNIQKTFSSVAEDERFSEKKWIDEVVSQTKVDAHFVYPSFRDLFRLTPHILWHQDEPYQSQSAFLGYHVFESAKKHGVKVLLNGQGADEYLSGYAAFRDHRWGKLFKKLRLNQLHEEISYATAGNSKALVRSYLNIFYSLSPEYFKRILRKKTKSYRQLKEIFSLDKLGASEKHPYDAIPAKNNNLQSIASHQLFYNPLPKYLRWEDRNSMAHSVEARVPFLDHRLVEYSGTLPDDYLDGKGQSKRIMIMGLKGILPEIIRNRKDKKGFITPEERWVKEDFSKEFRVKIQEAIEVSNGIITPKALPYFDNVVSGEIPFDYTYWRIIVFAEWIKTFDVEID
jgi:asparagine synthase (glutamine-hydrolysing)